VIPKLAAERIYARCPYSARQCRRDHSLIKYGQGFSPNQYFCSQLNLIEGIWAFVPFRTRTLLDIVNEISQSYIQSISMWEGLFFFFPFRPEIHIFFILFSLGSPADEKLRKYLEKIK
jgi:hypothetical protein